MVDWTPQLERNNGPLYLSLVRSLSADIRQGRLADGVRLPTHRDLARRLRVTVGTVTRAYLEARKRGLTRGEVGRGTFVVAGRPEGPPFGFAAAAPDSVVDLSMNFPPAVPADAAALAAALAHLQAHAAELRLLDIQPHPGSARAREAGAEWMRRLRFPADPAQVFVTSGSQHALLLSLAVLTRPGDTVLTEELCFPGLAAAAEFLRLRLRGLPMDELGLRPGGLAAAAREERAAALYTVPTLQNPTTRVMPEARRSQIAALAAELGLTIIEDDPYTPLLESAPAPLSAAAPERHFYIAGATKVLAGGLRVAWLHAPRAFHQALCDAVRASVFHAPALSAEIAALWVRDGTAAALAAARREEAAARQAIAARWLGTRRESRPEALHLWLPLAAEWQGGALCAAARARGVAVTPAEAFYAGRGRPPQAVRVCLGPPREHAGLERGLRALAELLHSAPQGWKGVY